MPTTTIAIDSSTVITGRRMQSSEIFTLCAEWMVQHGHYLRAFFLPSPRSFSAASGVARISLTFTPGRRFCVPSTAARAPALVPGAAAGAGAGGGAAGGGGGARAAGGAAD